jgi:D-alanyl-lipoteichoic acid acyltransferase DltB (MBOAT superfamily)
MLLGGLWHGAYLRFLIWGGLHGTGLIVDKGFRKIFPGSARPWYRRFLSKILTFHFVCFAWIFFRAADMTTVGNILSQISNHFAWPLIPVIVESYKGIVLLLIIGFIIHWLPNNFKEHYRGWFITSPIYAKVLVTVLVVILVYQMKSSALQPFIYFQF